jgi:hypothetical protein
MFKRLFSAIWGRNQTPTSEPVKSEEIPELPEKQPKKRERKQALKLLVR